MAKKLREATWQEALARKLSWSVSTSLIDVELRIDRNAVDDWAEQTSREVEEGIDHFTRKPPGERK